MADEAAQGKALKPSGGLFGSLRDALAAASREEDARLFGRKPAATAAAPEAATEPPGSRSTVSIAASLRPAIEHQPAAAPPIPLPAPPSASTPPALPEKFSEAQSVSKPMTTQKSPLPSAAEAAKDARGGAPIVPPVDRHMEADSPPTTRVVRSPAGPKAGADGPARTQLVRGKHKVARGEFAQDPVVGWLVIVGGPGLGSYRPIFEGNNTLGRASSQRIPIDFGDDAISSEEQAYVRYDSADRSFLFVPNLAKTNVVSVNDKKPTGAVPLAAMDVITVGRTQLVFVPFCGPDFDWAELTDAKG